MTSSKPITVHEDGAVTIRISPLMWRHLASAVVLEAGDCGPHQHSFHDPKGFLSAAAADRSLETPDGDVAADAALVLSAAAVLGYAEMGELISDGIEFDRVSERLDGLAALGVGVLISSDADVEAGHEGFKHFTADRLKAALVADGATS